MRAFLVLAVLGVAFKTLEAKSDVPVLKETLGKDEHNKPFESGRVSREATRGWFGGKTHEGMNTSPLPVGFFPVEFDVRKAFGKDDKDQNKDFGLDNILKNILNLPKNILKRICEFSNFMEREEWKKHQDQYHGKGFFSYPPWYPPFLYNYPPVYPHGYPRGFPHGYPHDYPGHRYPPRYPHDFSDRDYDDYPGRYPNEKPWYPQERNHRPLVPRADDLPRENGVGKGSKGENKHQGDAKIAVPENDIVRKKGEEAPRNNEVKVNRKVQET